MRKELVLTLLLIFIFSMFVSVHPAYAQIDEEHFSVNASDLGQGMYAGTNGKATSWRDGDEFMVTIDAEIAVTFLGNVYFNMPYDNDDRESIITKVEYYHTGGVGTVYYVGGVGYEHVGFFMVTSPCLVSSWNVHIECRFYTTDTSVEMFFTANAGDRHGYDWVELRLSDFYSLTISSTIGGTTSPSPGTHSYSYGSSVTVTASAYPSYRFIHWVLDGKTKYGNPITVTMDSDHTLKACIYSTVGCPILSVFDGSNYVTEGLLDIHNPDGIDLVYDHTLITEPAWTKGTYQFRLTEHPQTHSYIDQVKLYVMLEDGAEIKLLLIHAWHSEHGNVLPQLLRSDDVRTDTSANQTIDLKFVALPPNAEVTEFVFQIEGHNQEMKE